MLILFILLTENIIRVMIINKKKEVIFMDFAMIADIIQIIATAIVGVFGVLVGKKVTKK